MTSRMLLVLLLNGVVGAGCNRKQPDQLPVAERSSLPERQPIGLVTLGQRVDSPMLLWHKAPLPRTCGKGPDWVEFCAHVPMRMNRQRYEQLVEAWGNRDSSSVAVLENVLVEPERLVMHFSGQGQTPLMWFDNEHPSRLYLWPVDPVVEKIRYTANGSPITWEYLGNQAARIHWDISLPLRRWRLQPPEGLADKQQKLIAWDMLPAAGAQRWVIIDPGHGGGADKGAIVESLQESDHNLLVSFALQKAFEAQGWKVTLTRPGDFPVPLERRMHAAMNGGANLFLSIHHDFDEGTHRMSCIFGRPDLKNACQNIANITDKYIPGPSAHTRRYVFLTNTVTTPTFLLEVANFKDPRHRQIYQNARIRELTINKWSQEVAQWFHRNIQ